MAWLVAAAAYQACPVAAALPVAADCQVCLVAWAAQVGPGCLVAWAAQVGPGCPGAVCLDCPVVAAPPDAVCQGFPAASEIASDAEVKVVKAAPVAHPVQQATEGCAADSC